CVAEFGLAAPVRRRLLAVALEEGGKLGPVEGREQLGGWHAAIRVEPHVERASGPEAEAALGVGELEARKAEIEQESVHGGEPGVRGDRPQLAEVRPAEDQ